MGFFQLTLGYNPSQQYCCGCFCFCLFNFIAIFFFLRNSIIRRNWGKIVLWLIKFRVKKKEFCDHLHTPSNFAVERQARELSFSENFPWNGKYRLLMVCCCPIRIGIPRTSFYGPPCFLTKSNNNPSIMKFIPVRVCARSRERESTCCICRLVFVVCKLDSNVTPASCVCLCVLNVLSSRKKTAYNNYMISATFLCILLFVSCLYVWWPCPCECLYVCALWMYITRNVLYSIYLVVTTNLICECRF